MQLGFVGTGTMGAPMAGCLIDAGHRLTVYDIRREATAALARTGRAIGGKPAGGRAESEVVFTSFPGPHEVEAAVLDPATASSPGCGPAAHIST